MPTFGRKDRIGELTTRRTSNFQMLTGPDDVSFGHRVNNLLKLRYQLYGAPALRFTGKDFIVMQAFTLPGGHVESY